MKTTLFAILAFFMIGCEKSLENTTETNESLSVADLGVAMNSNYRVQQVVNGQTVDLPQPVLVKWISDNQVAEQVNTGDFMVNDYRVKGRGATTSSLMIEFASLLPRCDLNDCPVVVNDCKDAELVKQGSELRLIKHYDGGDKIYVFNLQ